MMHKIHKNPRIVLLLWWTNIAGKVEPAQTICAFKKSFTYLRSASNSQNTITQCNNDPSCIDLRKRFHENGHKIQDWTGSIIPGFAEWQEIDTTTGVCLLELEEQNMRVGG